MSDSSAQRVRVGPFAVSVDKQKPLIGAKISKVRTAPSASARAARLSVPPRAGTKGATPVPRTANRDDDRSVCERVERKKFFFFSFLFLVMCIFSPSRSYIVHTSSPCTPRASRTPPGTPP